ncbi:GTPase-activating protein CdGAPr isoform X1 [Bicyclus anynana]|uniref:GTPase-activating protein CdGAPr isoform X1 n=1 Tax=Bicyclus anynana TaxID=110368 RepID=A0ABM3LJ82_BICAN|nr:GTPase-activating protein CdGAPr isoform X1 [Bicyclus anynana]XP_052739128.1 GTPase-activating protein CdGAPr isoform X1 [Bicyclus anynana]
MSCQSLAARAFAEPDKDSHCARTTFHRTVRFSSDSRSQTTRTSNETECKRDTPGSMSLSALSVTPMSQGSAMSQSAPTASTTFDIDIDSPPPPAACRFPKLEECAHFHYERVSLGGLCVELVPCDTSGDSPCEGWVCLKVRSHVNSAEESSESRALSASWTEASDVREWTLTRNMDNFLQLDEMLHRCIYERKVSGLPNLKECMTPELVSDEAEYRQLIADYVHHLSIIADDSINCGPALNWLQMDNKGHKLLVSNEDSSSINTPAVAAAYSVRKYVSQARDEISFEVGDMISIIDMPVLSFSAGPQESLWWRGKRGFRVGFFPHHCVAVIGDKVPRHMTQPPPIVGSVAVAPIKPVLRKHGKLISLFRSFILSRPSRRSLKQQGILRERVFGCDLGEHLLNCGHDVPLVLVECSRAIERRGAVDGVYRLSGGAALTQRLRAAFDAGQPVDLLAPLQRDPHALASLLKMYFRELPNPLCTYQLYDGFVSAVQAPEDCRLRAMRDTVVKLPPPHYRTLAYLMRHLRRVSLLSESTGMTARNMAIVWAPNLLRSPKPQHALQGVAVQAVVTEFLICYAEELFAQEQGADSGPQSLEQDQYDSHVELRGLEAGRRPKSLPMHPPTKLLSLEEARRRGKSIICETAPPAPGASGAIAAAASETLRPASHLKPKYIEVGSGPNNLPQYHTVLELPVAGSKRALKRSPSGWRGLFSRSKLQRAPARPPDTPPQQEVVACAAGLRPAKSCESLTSETDALPPLAAAAAQPSKHHTRSSSCDSYFEPWQAELAGMRLRLSPQERDHNMFSEEDDTAVHLHNAQDDSLCSSPPESGAASAAPSPRRPPRPDTDLAERKRVALEQLEAQVAQLGYIDGDPDTALPDKRPAAPKRLCKDRDSPLSSTTDFQTSLANVKLRERHSPRKQKGSARYSGMHHPVLSDPDKSVTRLTWHGKDGHSTLIKIDWPAENSSISNLTTSTLNSSPVTPLTPIYDPLESDSEVSDNKHTITIKSNDCETCDEEKCLKCELKATDYENIKDMSRQYSEQNLHDSLEASPLHSTDISYQNLNRLSAVSTSSNSDQNSHKKESDAMKIMTSSHESSSSYSNVSFKQDELYECYNFSRPNYINLSSSTSKSSPGSPLKSPLKSTISITFRSPVKVKTDDYEPIGNMETPTNERDSVYEDIDLEKNLSIVEEATVPQTDASLPTQQACQPDDFDQDLIILETPTESTAEDNIDVYSQVKFFRKSIQEVNAMILESPEKEPCSVYENVEFEETIQRDYENINVDTLKICDKVEISSVKKDESLEKENGNVIKPTVTTKNLNVRELAIRFESPTEQKGPFNFDKYKTEVKYPTLERKEEKLEKKKDTKPPPISPKTYKLSKNSNARSLDENAFVKEFGNEKDRRRSLEVKDVKRQAKYLPDLNLNMEEPETKLESITPTTENKLSLIQRFDVKKPTDLKNLIGFDTEKKLSRERIEKYKEERRNFLREKYSSQSFRSNPEQLTRIKLKKDEKECERLKEELPKFERRNTVDLGQRMRFSLARSANNLDTIPSPISPADELPRNGDADDINREERREKVSPSYNIRDMAAMFEQKSQGNG